MMEDLRGRLPAILAGTTIVAAVIAAVILLTGGDDAGPEQAANEVAAVPDSSESPASKAEKSAVDEATAQAAKAAAQSESEGETKLSRDEIRKRLKVVPPAQRREFALAAARAVLRSYGYPNVDIRLSKNGEIVTVLIPPADACAQEASRIPEVERRLLEVILFAREVHLMVIGYGDLAAYVRANCKPLQVPAASGRVLWSASGTGLKSSDQFQVTANRFTVSYANNSGELEIYVTRGEQLIEPVIKSDKRETGSQTYAGPGTFRVTVSGSGSWEVKVYDGA